MLRLIRRLSTVPRTRLPTGYTQPTPHKDDLIIVAMSSGVDSSVAAAMYAKEYPRVKGLFMMNWNQMMDYTGEQEGCLEKDWKDVQKVADQLDIPLEQASFEKEYWTDVFEPMIDGYSKGITPNPDINCNRYVKFGRLMEYCQTKFAHEKKWWLVTGHYSRILYDEKMKEHHLLRAYYKKKDQSYYLSQINPEVLSKVLLPIGHYTKPEIRDMAHELQLPVASKPDSTGLCFVNPTNKDFKQFLSYFIPDQPGNVVTKDGKIWGQHQGLWSYTIGQKSGISMPQGDPEYKGQWFISEKNYETNEMVIVKGKDNPDLFKSVVYVSDFMSLSSTSLHDIPIEELNVQYRSLQQPSTLVKITKSPTSAKLIFQLSSKQRAIAPGQYLAVYHHDRCLGSGVIEYVE